MTQECATNGCKNAAVWYAIREGNVKGNEAPKRCTVCCDAIAAHDIPAFSLHDADQLAYWSSIYHEYRSDGSFDGSGIKRVLALTPEGTSLVRWFGPVEK